jgi:hypothetical protein
MDDLSSFLAIPRRGKMDNAIGYVRTHKIAQLLNDMLTYALLNQSVDPLDLLIYYLEKKVAKATGLTALLPVDRAQLQTEPKKQENGLRQSRTPSQCLTELLENERAALSRLEVARGEFYEYDKECSQAIEASRRIISMVIGSLNTVGDGASSRIQAQTGTALSPDTTPCNSTLELSGGYSERPRSEVLRDLAKQHRAVVNMCSAVEHIEEGDAVLLRNAVEHQNQQLVSVIDSLAFR